MKSILLLATALLLFCGSQSFAQSYEDEIIDCGDMKVVNTEQGSVARFRDKKIGDIFLELSVESENLLGPENMTINSISTYLGSLAKNQTVIILRADISDGQSDSITYRTSTYTRINGVTGPERLCKDLESGT